MTDTRKVTSPRFRSRLARQSLALAAMLAVVAGVLSLVEGSDAPSVLGVTQGRVTTNDLNRTQATQLWNSTLALPEVATGSTGSVAGCQVGAVSDAYRNDQLARVNAFRRFAGLGALPWNVGEAAAAQQAALWTAANGISHNNDPTSTCYAETRVAGGPSANASSLLASIGNGLAIRSYMSDWGQANVAVPHRDWILMPTATSVGAGAVAGYNALRFAYAGASSAAVPWPPAGDVPFGLVYDRWSLGLDGHDASGAQVEVIRNGARVQPTIEFRGDHGLGGIVVFSLPSEAEPSRSGNTRYDVTVSGVRRNGEAITYSWTTTVFQPEPTVTPPAVSGGLTENVIRALYRDLANRAPSAAELAAAAGRPRSEVITELVSGEAWIGGYVDSMYQDILGRNPDAGGRSFWVGEIRAGRRSIETAVASFYSSDEIVGRFGSDRDWMAAVMQSLLDRPADAGGLTHWVGRADAIGRGAAVVELYRSSESRQVRVATIFEGILGRAPDPTGLTYWSGELLRISDLQMAGFVANDDEYEVRNS